MKPAATPDLGASFRVLASLESGGEADVWLVEDLRRDGRLAALKVFRGASAGAPAEFQKLAGLRHRSLAQVFDAGVLPGSGARFLTTAYFAGAPLTALPAPFSWDLFFALLRETCEVLAYLNDAGYRHGDLKPRHILFAAAPALGVRIIDLGHAARLDDTSAVHAGTPAYAAPELWGAGKPGRNTDLYALAISCLEVFCGGLPMACASAAEWRDWHLGGDRRRVLEQVALRPPQALLALLGECLAPDPADRPRDARALLARLPPARIEIAQGEFVPALVGRADALRSLEAWCLESGPAVPRALLLEGHAGIGKSRVLRALARSAQVRGSTVLVLEGDPPLAPRAARGGGDAAPQLGSARYSAIFVDGYLARSEGQARSLVRWLKRAGPGADSPPRALIAIDAASDGKALAGLDAELERAGFAVERRRLGPIDFSSSLALAEECARAPATAAEMQRVANAGAGIPRRIVELSGAGAALAATCRAATLAPDLAALLCTLPAPAPVSALISALGWTRAKFFREMAAAGDRAPLLEGVHPEIVVHPLAPRAPASASPTRDRLLALAQAWEGTASRERDWAPVCLRSSAQLPVERDEIVALGERLSKEQRWRALAQFAACFADRFPEMEWLLLRALWREGRFAEAFDRLSVLAPDPGAVPAPAAADIARLLADCGALTPALEFFRASAASMQDPVERIDLAIEAARVALACGERSRAEAVVRELDGNGAGGLAAARDASPAVTQRFARLLLQLGQHERAAAAFRAALAAARRGGERESGTVVASLGGLALADRALGDLAHAEYRLRLALRYGEISRHARDHRSEMQALRGNLAAVLYRAGKVDAALECYERLEREVRRGGNWRLLPHIGLGVGTIYRERGALLLALRRLHRAKRDAERLHDDGTVFGIERNLGEIYLLLGDPASAYAHRLRALRIARAMRNPELIRHGRFALGAALVRRGRYREGQRLLELALATAAPGDGRRLTSMTHAFLGEVHRHFGDQQAALAAWARASRDGIRSGNIHYVCRAIGGMASVLAARGREARARALLARAVEWARSVGTPALARVPLQWERLRVELRAAPPARETLEQTCALYHAARGHGLREEALAALTLYAEHAARFRLPLPEGAGVFARAMLRRFDGEGLRALEDRLGVPLARWNRDAGASAAPDDGGSLEPDADIEAALEQALARSGARAARIVVDPAGAAIVVARAEAAGAPAAAAGSALRVSLPLWSGAPETVAIFEAQAGAAAPVLSREEIAGLTSRALPVIAKSAGDEKERELRGLRLELDRLREQRLADRERVRTEMLTQRLALEERTKGGRGAGPAPGDHAKWIAAAPAMQEIERNLSRWAQSDLPVFIHGESGTGKDTLARRVHARSSRAAKPCHIENCSALPAALFEAELFGYRAGAFTGAEKERAGLLRHIDGGTLVLDQVDEVPLEVQGKLLRVLEERAFRPLGSGDLVRVDLRIMATCRSTPQHALSAGRLRADLFYRLQGIAIEVPPLRARTEEIPALIASHCEWHAARLQLPIPTIEPAALARLSAYPWPGNIRELSNLVLRWLLLRLRSVTEAVALPEGTAPDQQGIAAEAAVAAAIEGAPWREAMRSFQRRFLLECLERHAWNRSRTAAMLGLSRRQLHNLLAKLELS
ncbi:MAG: sigma 54-interacting transcriptional regulator [Planctomycetes bacterium]|nr:sigma 54-interacting transcriptional regulator [Planctomycetota bacterium]